MKRNFKRILSLLLCAAMIFTVAGTAFSADERKVVETGFCGENGENLTWTLYDDGELVISGEGKMDWYYVNLKGEDEFLEVLPPWYSYYSQIKVITLEEGVTSIGNHAFAGENLGYHRVNIPMSLKEYDGYPLDCADNSCDSGKTCNVYYQGDKFDWGNNIARMEPKFTLNEEKNGYVRENKGAYISYDISTKTEKIRKIEMCFLNETPEYSCVLYKPSAGNLVKDKGDKKELKVFYNANGREDIKLIWKTKGDSLEIEYFEDAGGTGLQTNAVVTAVGYGTYFVWVELVDGNGKVLASSEKIELYTEIYEEMNFFEKISYQVTDMIAHIGGRCLQLAFTLGVLLEVFLMSPQAFFEIISKKM